MTLSTLVLSILLAGAIPMSDPPGAPVQQCVVQAPSLPSQDADDGIGEATPWVPLPKCSPGTIRIDPRREAAAMDPGILIIPDESVYLAMPIIRPPANVDPGMIHPPESTPPPKLMLPDIGETRGFMPLPKGR